MAAKVLAGKAYGHIPHLPGSRMGPADHHCHEGQARICTEKARDRNDRIIVQEKLDGSCVGILRQGSQILPIIRAGYAAVSSPYEHHQLFARWALACPANWFSMLNDGERLMGEWLALAHGTRYELPHGPFVPFDLIGPDNKRRPYDAFAERVALQQMPAPFVIHDGGPMTIPEAIIALGRHGHHGAIDIVEGAVWRVERRGVPDIIAKYVRPDKIDGSYLPESGHPPVWNWRPSEEQKDNHATR